MFLRSSRRAFYSGVFEILASCGVFEQTLARSTISDVDRLLFSSPTSLRMIQIKLDLEPERQAPYAAALARLRDVEVTTGRGHALITTKVGESSLPTLLDQPEITPPELLSSLAGASIMPAHPWRFSPSIHPVEESRSSGQLGEAGLLRVHHWLIANTAPEHIAFSQVDLAHWFFGAPPTHTHGLSRANYLQVHLGFAKGGMALLDLATNRPGPDNYYSLHLIGSRGAAYSDDHRNAHLLFGEEGPRALIHQENQLLAMQTMLTEFLAGIREERPWSVRLQDTIDALATVKEAAHV